MQLALGAITVQALGVTLCVDGATGHDTDACGTMISPCATISYAVNERATNFDTILVAQGVYTENLDVGKPVTLQGGYESAGWTRDIAAHETIIDGSNNQTVEGDWDGSWIHQSSVLPDPGSFMMWYAGADFRGVSGFGLATSGEGEVWTKE